MKISVIMITHNRENFVGHMISDILGQSFCDFEYIIVDNASTDKSGTIVDMYAEQDARIRSIHLSEEVSIGKARNIGLSYAKGEFVIYVDDDDRAEGDFLELLDSMSENMDFVTCGTLEEQGGKVEPQCVFVGRYKVNARRAVEELLKREHIRAGMPAKLFRREILLKYPFREDCRHEDIFTTYKYLSEIQWGAVSGIPKYCFVRHGGNVSYFTTDCRMLRPEQLEEYLLAFSERTEFISHKFPDMAGLAQYSEWSYMLSMCRKISEGGLDSCKPQYEKMWEQLHKHRNEFCASPFVKEFERIWMEKEL